MKIKSTLLCLAFIFNYTFLNAQLCTMGNDRDNCSCHHNAKLSTSGASGPFTLKLYVHRILDSDESAGVDKQGIANMISDLDSYFTGSSIHFEWDCYINYINDPTVQNNNSVFSYISSSDGIDIIIFSEDRGGGSQANGFGVESQLRIAGTYLNGYENIPVTKFHLLAHEIGHTIGLDHTFHCSTDFDHLFAAEILNLDQSTTQDCIQDTPFDPSAIYCSTSTDPCEFDKDCPSPFLFAYPESVLDSLNPDMTNIMGYINPDCLTANFTNDQKQKMRNVIDQEQFLQLCLIQTSDYIVSGSETINSHRAFYQNVIVPSGAILTINADVSMAVGKSITVENGGELIVNSATIGNYCGDKWKGIIVEGNPYISQGTGITPSAEVTLNSATIENAEVGITTYIQLLLFTNSGGLVTATNSNFINCDTGIDFGPYGYFGWTIQDDASILDQCTFDNCYTGIKTWLNRGIETKACTFTNTGTAIDLETSNMQIDDNIFSNSTNFGVYSHHNWPQVDALSLTNNTFSTGFNDVILSGPGNILSLDITNNSFFSPGGLDNYGLTSGNVLNNDFINNFEGAYIEHVGSNSRYNVGANFFSGSYYATSNLGFNSLLEYLGNCFEEINYYNIEINDNSGVFPSQGEDGGAEAGNCFDKAVPSILTGQNTDFFTYHIKDNIPQSDCKHPASPGSNNWGLENNAIDPDDRPCGSNFTSSIPSSLFNCTIPTDEAGQIAFIDSLLNQITLIEADSTLTEYQQKWLIQRLRKCMKKVEGKYVSDRMQETDGREKVLTYLQGSDDFDMRILAYGIKMNDKDYLGARNLLLSLVTTEITEQSDFVESQLIYINHLRTGIAVSESDLDVIYDNAIERNPYSCFSRSIYYSLAGIRIDLPHIHINNSQPRIQNEPSIEQEQYTVYPNPINNNELNIESKETVYVVVMDLSGRVIYENSALDEPIRVVLNNYISNVYVVRFTNQKGEVTLKKVIRI